MKWTTHGGWHYAETPTLNFRIEPKAPNAPAGLPVRVEATRGRSRAVACYSYCRNVELAKQWAGKCLARSNQSHVRSRRSAEANPAAR